ncbi:hypothetical protein ACKVWC_009401, partial [Pyricularia oryzae]
ENIRKSVALNIQLESMGLFEDIGVHVVACTMPLRMMLYDVLPDLESVSPAWPRGAIGASRPTADSLHAQSLEPQDVNTNQHRSSSIQCPNCQQTVFPSEDGYTEHHKKKHPEDRVQLTHPLRHSKQTN